MTNASHSITIHVATCAAMRILMNYVVIKQKMQHDFQSKTTLHSIELVSGCHAI